MDQHTPSPFQDYPSCLKTGIKTLDKHLSKVSPCGMGPVLGLGFSGAPCTHQAPAEAPPHLGTAAQATGDTSRGGGAVTFEVLHVLLQLLEDLVSLSLAEEQPVVAAQALGPDLLPAGSCQPRGGLLRPRPLPAAPCISAGAFNHEPVHWYWYRYRHGETAEDVRLKEREKRRYRACVSECPAPLPLARLRPARARARFWRQIGIPLTRRPAQRRRHRSVTTMIGQKTLHSFFSAAPAKKRSRSPEPDGDAEVAGWGSRRRWSCDWWRLWREERG